MIKVYRETSERKQHVGNGENRCGDKQTAKWRFRYIRPAKRPLHEVRWKPEQEPERNKSDRNAPKKQRRQAKRQARIPPIADKQKETRDTETRFDRQGRRPQNNRPNHHAGDYDHGRKESEVSGEPDFEWSRHGACERPNENKMSHRANYEGRS